MRARQASRAAVAEAAAGPEEPEGPATPTAVGDLARAWDAVWGDDEDRMVDFLSAEASEQDKEEAARLYELLLVNGATAAEGQAKVSELFSVPRVTKLLRPNMSLGKGLTFDLHGDIDGRSWDFLKAADRREAMTRIREQRPYLVIGSPPCTAFSQLSDRWNYRRMHPEVVKRRRVEGRMLLEFAAQVYREQLAGGRHFLHEHPASASSWHEPCIQRLCSAPGVHEVVGDQCRFGLQSPGENGKLGPAKKATRFLSSAAGVLRALGRRCQGDHVHVQLLGGRRAAAAAVYPRGLCRAILRSIEAQRRRERREPLGVARAQATGAGVYSLEERTGEDEAVKLASRAVEPSSRLCKVTFSSLQETDVVPEPDQTRVGDEAEMLLEFGEGVYWDENTG